MPVIQSLTTVDLVACDSITHHCSQTIAVAGFPSQTNSLAPSGGASVLEASPSSDERHHQAKAVRALATIDDEPASSQHLPWPPSSASTAASSQQSNPRAFSIVMPVLESFAPAIFANGGDSRLLPGEEEIIGKICGSQRLAFLFSALLLLSSRFWHLL